MGVQWRNEPNVVTEEDVARLERTLGVRFPEEYRDVLLNHDGQEVEPCHFQTEEGQVHALQFLSLHSGLLSAVANNIGGGFDFLRDGVVPIAREPGISPKGFVFLDFREQPAEPSLYFARLGDEDQFISASFAEFIESLFDSDA